MPYRSSRGSARSDGGERYGRLCRLLEQAVPGLKAVERVAVRDQETIQFSQDLGHKNPMRFDALSMSDGTLRILGILLALQQDPLPTLIAIEEPEATVHPAIADLLVEALLDRSRDVQVLLTTHSPDLLDAKGPRITRSGASGGNEGRRGSGRFRRRCAM